MAEIDRRPVGVLSRDAVIRGTTGLWSHRAPRRIEARRDLGSGVVTGRLAGLSLLLGFLGRQIHKQRAG